MDSSYYSTPETQALTGAAWAGIIIFFVIMAILSYVLYAFLLSRIFKKAGVPEWAAWVPIYNVWKLYEIGDQPGFWVLLSFIPFVGFVSVIFMYIAMYNIGKKLGKEGWFVLVAIFLPIIWMLWLGFDDSKWPADDKKKLAPKKK